MELSRAYEIAMNKVEELKKSGICVEIKTLNPNISDSIKKMGELEFDKQRDICFKNLTKKQASKIYEAATYLGALGITFDLGGIDNTRDWEFDWSFKYTFGREDKDWSLARAENEKALTA